MQLRIILLTDRLSGAIAQRGKSLAVVGSSGRHSHFVHFQCSSQITNRFLTE